jgi:hypothetical protein
MADDRNIAQSAIEVLKNLRGSGAPLAARTNDIINNLLGPHLGRSVAPVVALADVASMGADIRDTMEFSGDTVDSLRAGDYGKAAIDALYTAAAPLGMVLPGSVGMYRKGAEEVADAVRKADLPKALPTDEASRMARGYSGEANTTLARSRQMPDDQATKLIKSRIGQITRDAKLRGAPPSGPYAIEIGALRNRLREIKAGAALSQQDGFDYGALSNVAEGSNGQRSN